MKQKFLLKMGILSLVLIWGLMVLGCPSSPKPTDEVVVEQDADLAAAPEPEPEPEPAPPPKADPKEDPPVSPTGLQGKSITLAISSANTALVTGKKVYVVVYAAADANTPVAWGMVASAGTTGTGAIKLANWGDNATVWTGSGSVYYRVLIGNAGQNYTQCAYYTFQGDDTTEDTQTAGTAMSVVFGPAWKPGTGNPPGMPGF